MKKTKDEFKESIKKSPLKTNEEKTKPLYNKKGLT